MVLAPSTTAAASLQERWFQRGQEESPKGGLDQTLHGTRQDSCIHTSRWHDLEDVGAAQMVPKERSAEGTRLSVAFCRGRCCQKHSLHYPGCIGSCKQCWTNMWLSYLHHYQTHIKSKWLKTIWWIMCNTFQQLSSVSHVEISTSWDQMSSSDLITTNQLKKLQLNSQQSWNSPWTQGPLTCFGGVAVFSEQKLQAIKAATSTYCSFHLWVLDMPSEAGFHSQVFLHTFSQLKNYLRQLRSKQTDK